MNLLTLLVLLAILVVVLLVIRSMVRVYKSSRNFPVFSICVLSISLVFLISGTVVLIFISDALGGALTGLGSFFGLLEANVRHKREAAEEKAV